jgi:adenylosuccinate synthase
MSAVVLVGAQWGDEGEGKATDLSAARSTTWSGTTGATTPGTVVIDGETYAPHSIVSISSCARLVGPLRRLSHKPIG